VSIVAILLPLRISKEQGVRKETKDNGGFETEHQGRSSSTFSQHAATSDAELPETLGWNVLTTRDATSQTLSSGTESCNSNALS
jgi:hypothetical protein